jgi:hypothetical protein
MRKTKWFICIGGLALCMVIQAFSLKAQQGTEGGSPPAGTNTSKAEKSLLPATQSTPETNKNADQNCKCVSDSDPASTEKIERVLKGRLHSNGFDFTETPLRALISQIQTDYGIQIYLDARALDAAGINGDEPVTITARDMSLQSALRHILNNLQLTYVIQNEALIITTTEAATKAYATVCVYQVHDIVGNSDKALDSLVDTITTCIATQTWAENGGDEAQIRTVKPGLLVISQESGVHEQIRGLLTTIRNMHEQLRKTANASPPANDSSSEDVITKAYYFPVTSEQNGNLTSNQLRELIESSLPDEKWSGRLADGQAVSITSLPDRVIVRQTPSVQEKVQKILSDSGFPTPANGGSNNGGGMGGGIVGGFGGGAGTVPGRGGFGGGGRFGRPAPEPGAPK